MKIHIKQLITSFTLAFGVIALYDGLQFSRFIYGMGHITFIIGFVIIPFVSGILLIIGYYSIIHSKYYHRYSILLGLIFNYAYRIYKINHWISVVPQDFEYWLIDNFYEIVILIALFIFTILLLYYWKNKIVD